MSVFFGISRKVETPSSYLEALVPELLTHYFDVYPREAIGVITDEWDILRLKNLSRYEDRFATFPISLLFKGGWGTYWRGEGLELVYHSHRKVTNPSKTDEAFMEFLYGAWPQVNHLIFTPDGEYSVWQYVP